MSENWKDKVQKDIYEHDFYLITFEEYGSKYYEEINRYVKEGGGALYNIQYETDQQGVHSTLVIQVMENELITRQYRIDIKNDKLITVAVNMGHKTNLMTEKLRPLINYIRNSDEIQWYLSGVANRCTLNDWTEKGKSWAMHEYRGAALSKKYGF